MNYTLHQLQIFERVSHYQSITKAAEELFLTQPAVSIQLKNFQNQFPVPLFEVIGRKLYITEFGREIAKTAQEVLTAANEINYRTRALGGQLAGNLKLGVVSTGKYVMPYFLSDFMKIHPGVDLVMDVTNKLNVVENLEANSVDFALVSVLPEHLKLNALPLLPNVLQLVANQNYFKKVKLAKKSNTETVPLIFRENGSATRAAMENYLKKEGIQTEKKIELTSNEAVKQAVIAGLGCSIMPIIGLKNELQQGDLSIVSQRKLPIKTTWNLVWLKNKKLSPVANALLAYLEEAKDKIVIEQFEWLQEYQSN
ncbi:LysR family transcriptional regulator [Croceivirga lutea]|uniref:LysR family transcriptional regulator n=1 Tax=Croceivirga lutea TaxID=1775167 RepID=UPI001639CCD6|nr:LysR family transcriptional regulator [Croceivirga lutea]GGG36832.1 LysR family transcriptional regulator [Croceivirga lutea]